MTSATAPSPVALFIYYKVEPAQSKAFQEAVRTMQVGLRLTHEGLTAKLWIRTGAEAAVQTWMETYEHAEGISVLQATLIELAAQDLPAGQVGKRQVEMFNNVD